MINIYKNSYAYKEEDRLYLIHDEILVVFEGDTLVEIFEVDLGKDEITENMAHLITLLADEGTFDLLGGKVTVVQTADLHDEYQLKAYAKSTVSSPCAFGGGGTGGAFSDDNTCITYAP